MKTRTDGAGITKPPHLDYEMMKREDQIKIAQYFVDGGPNDFENVMLQPIEKNAWRFLHKAGLTREKLIEEVVLTKAALWSSLKVRLPDRGEESVIQAAYNLTNEKRESREGCAALWLIYIRQIRAIRDSDPDGALRFAFDLGARYMEAAIKFNMKFNLKPLAMLGLSHKKAAQQGGKTRAAQVRAKMEERNQQIREHADRLRESHSPREIAGVLKPHYHLSVSRIRKILK